MVSLGRLLFTCLLLLTTRLLLFLFLLLLFFFFSSLLFKELSFWMLRSLCVFYRKIHIIKAESNNPMVMTDEMMLLFVKDVNEPTHCLGLHSSSFCLSLTQLLKTILLFEQEKWKKIKRTIFCTLWIPVSEDIYIYIHILEFRFFSCVFTESLTCSHLYVFCLYAWC